MMNNVAIAAGNPKARKATNSKPPCGLGFTVKIEYITQTTIAEQITLIAWNQNLVRGFSTPLIPVSLSYPPLT